MNLSNNDITVYRFSKAMETLEEAKLLASADHWNAVANRLYYAAFYAVCALLTLKEINYKSHNGVKKAFHDHFIRTQIFNTNFGILYNRLFNNRQEGDYLDFQNFDKSEIEPYLSQTKDFIDYISTLLTSHD
jgi:uncharacterized protein